MTFAAVCGLLPSWWVWLSLPAALVGLCGCYIWYLIITLPLQLTLCLQEYVYTVYVSILYTHVTYHIYTLYMIVVCSSNSPASFMSVIAALAFTGLEPPARDRKDSCSVRFASLVCCLLVWPHSRNPRGYWASQEPIWLPHGRTMRELQ